MDIDRPLYQTSRTPYKRVGLSAVLVACDFYLYCLVRAHTGGA